jgi:hypothetical protein
MDAYFILKHLWWLQNHVGLKTRKLRVISRPQISPDDSALNLSFPGFSPSDFEAIASSDKINSIECFEPTEPSSLLLRFICVATSSRVILY